ncbi:glycosyltransferase family 2 protein [Paenibacillus cisolokensis]|uniref:glycosyltransferase family 2 protein n=1 Tax=Paenibacillus cisolokensis TaxID=1658519 RepID=UPI003D2C2E24
MNIVITMAGMGSRFRRAGYLQPKYMINVKGRSLFYWSIISLKSFDFSRNHFIFIVQSADDAKGFIREECSKLGVIMYDIVEIDHLTDGQATTVLFGKPYWTPESPLLIYNIDTHVKPGVIYKNTINDDGWIPCFNAPGDKWSFVKLNEENQVIEVREKKRISNYATIGLYWFSSARLYEHAYNLYYSLPGREEKGERYIAPIYNQLIQNNYKVTISLLATESVHILGTPEEVESFLKCDYDFRE